MTKIQAIIFDYDGVLSHWLQKDDRMYQFAQELRRRGYKTAVLSNQIKPIALVVRWLKHLIEFNPRIVSCDVGLAKPHPAIYELILKQLDLPASNCIFIDDRERNVKTAQSLGIHTVIARQTEQVIKEVETILASR